MPTSVAHTSVSVASSIPSSSPTDTSSLADKESKQGRPNQWSASRQRQLARIYSYTNLPREDIPRVLMDNGDKWLPGKESTTKTVNAILGKQPRWLRPKDRKDMDKKIKELSECKKQRKLRRQWSPTSPKSFPDGELPIPNSGTSTTFSETPLEDLLAFAPDQPFRSLPPSQLVQGIAKQGSSEQDTSFPEEPILPTFIFPKTAGVDDSGKELDFDGRSSSSTYLSITSLKRRLSQYSPSYIKAVARVIKAHSISNSSAATLLQPNYSITIHSSQGSTIGTKTIKPPSSTEATVKQRSPRLLLPSSILVLDRHLLRQGICVPGLKSHDLKTCWCLEDLNIEKQAWIDRAGIVAGRGYSESKRLTGLDLGFRDIFGNTALHLQAARSSSLNTMIESLEKGVDGNAKNSAGQNFLHVLSSSTLDDLAMDSHYLSYFLQATNRFGVSFFDRDIFGRSFLHLLTHQAELTPDRQNPSGIFSFLGLRLPRCRDAFGWVPSDTRLNALNSKEDQIETIITCRKCTHLPSPEDSHNHSISTQHRDEITDLNNLFTNTSQRCRNVDLSDEGSAILHHNTHLLQTVRYCIESPKLEDTQGRNGLQCLAEAALDTAEIPVEGVNKRKRGQNTTQGSTRLTLRFERVQDMISVGVDVNHYDKHGNTVLIAFVTHLPDGEDDKTLMKIFHHLIESGANLHWRNRTGETALHIAVRLGRKVATRVLLERGANVHARTSEGKGVLVVGEAHYFAAREEPKLYACIMACMALCIQYGAVATPTLVQEWSNPYGGFLFPWI